MTRQWLPSKSDFYPSTGMCSCGRPNIYCDGHEPPRQGDPTMDLTVEQIARVCHETNRAWCEVNGDFSQMTWDNAEDWQRQSAVEGVSVAMAGATPEQQHDAWCQSKVRDGWAYGDVKDPEAKTHPCLVPYSDLPADQRVKDHLFVAIVSTLSRTDAEES